MATLESYLTGEMHRDRADVAAIDNVLNETARTIASTFEVDQWPYEVRKTQTITTRRFSHSTTAMMIRAVNLLLGESTSRPPKRGYPFGLKDGTLAARLDSARGSATEKLLTEIGAYTQDISTRSGTYGTNDPITASFLSELHLDEPESIRGYLMKSSQSLLTIDPQREAEKFFDFSANEDSVNSTPLSNAFIPLRVSRTFRTASDQPIPSYLAYFESTLHEHLSFASIPDSRFDPAELAFCLEGMLLASTTSVDPALFCRVVDVLRKAQETSAHWRPAKPFLRSERGMVLFPVSVEVANSLIRSCQLVEAERQYDRFTDEVLQGLRRFWEWLRARRLSIELGDGSVVTGWHSEHVADIATIQLWDTAQVVEFLIGYRRSLHFHIARTTLLLARFDVRQPDGIGRVWMDPTAPMGAADHRNPATVSETADGSISSGPANVETIVSKYEPVTSLGHRFETYRQIGLDFVTGWLEGAPRNFSMLLYGPPGTGKTTVVENLADVLNFPMITITVSDFLAEGGGAVEARAKMIFDVLEAQADCVVLFDEIDELILDRSSKRHREQDTSFKFMTPGMLTKINNLRRKQRLIFALATNYAYRIDPAIKRTGRIDQNYLLLPPDGKAREAMIRQATRSVESNQLLANLSAEQMQKLVSSTHFLSYSDINAATKRVSMDPAASVESLRKEFLRWARTTSLRFYLGAFDEADDSKWVCDEFLPMAELEAREGNREKLIPFIGDGCKGLFESEDDILNKAADLGVIQAHGVTR